MKFSIIIPIYKTEKYVRQCVDSVLIQDFRDFELILVDNESPDSCPEICENYAQSDNRVRVIHKKHGSAASARNVGMKAAQGEYLCFLDSDDWWINDKVLSKIYEKISDGKSDIVELYYTFYYQNSGKYFSPTNFDFTGFEQMDNAERLNFLIKNDSLNPSAWGMCISREFIVKNQGYFKEDLITEDIEWCIRLYSACPRVNALPEAIYVYRKNREGSITSNMKFKNIDDLCCIVENAPNLLCDENNPVHTAMMNYVTYQSLIAAGLICRKNTLITKEERRQIKNRLKVFCKKYLKIYDKHPKVRKALKVYRVAGFMTMARVLAFYLNHRGR